VRGDSVNYNARLIEANAKRWATNRDEVDMERALQIVCEFAAEQFACSGSGYGRYGGPLEGTPRHKSRYADPILVDGES